jgi:hypothetical protein
MFKLTPKGLEASDIDSSALRHYIESQTANELGKMSQDCYYPRIAPLFKDLMHKTNTTEQELKKYSTARYKMKWRLLHDPYSTLLILICQHFLNDEKSLAGGMWAFNLFALRYYSNIMHKFIPQGCNAEYFRAAMERLSHSHLFRTKSTIGNSILYLSKVTFQKYEKALRVDNPDLLEKMIYEVRTRIGQSMRSFYGHYYASKEDKEKISSKDEKDRFEKESLENKKRTFSSNVSKDICIYHKIDEKSIEESRQLTKFNKEYAKAYARSLANPAYQEKIELLIMLMLRPITDLKMICSNQFLDYIKLLMAVKTSTKPVYFKKVLVELHDEHIVPSLGIKKWFDTRSIQTKKMSRDCLAYYLAFFVRTYLC